MSLNMESLLNPQSNHRIMGEQLVMVQDFHDVHHHVSNSCSSSSSVHEDEEEHAFEEEEKEEEEVVNSTTSTPLQDMSSLLQQLPLKRGLSKHYNGRSQSFASLSSVRCLEDLAKPENPYNKKLKISKSYRRLMPRNYSGSRLIGKKSSNRGSNLSSLVRARRNPGFTGNISHDINNNNKPAKVPSPHRSTNSFTNQTPLYA